MYIIVNKIQCIVHCFVI